MGKVFEFLSLYMAKDWEGMFKFTCESVFGMVRGDIVYAEIKPILDKYFMVA